MSYSQWIRTSTRNRIYARDHWVCLWCRRDLSFASPFDRTLDHVIPRSHGGSHRPNNLVTCCRTCNDLRKDTTLLLFAYQLADRHTGRTDQPLRLVARRASVILSRILAAVCAELPRT